MSKKEVWGRAQWTAIHSFAACLSNKTKYGYITYINSLPDTMPCGACRTHFKELLKKYPIELNVKNNREAFAWSFIIHNEVNAQIGKPIFKYSEALKMYRVM